MNLLRIGLLMLLSVGQVTAITIENKTPTELTVWITSRVDRKLVVDGRRVPTNTKTDFPLKSNGYKGYEVRVESSGGLINQNLYGYNDQIQYSGDGKTFLQPY